MFLLSEDEGFPCLYTGVDGGVIPMLFCFCGDRIKFVFDKGCILF